MERLQKFWLAGACYFEKDKKGVSNKTLGILNFTSAFILLGGGVLLSVMLLLLEFLYFRFGRRCLRKINSCKCCGFISLVSVPSGCMCSRGGFSKTEMLFVCSAGHVGTCVLVEVSVKQRCCLFVQFAKWVHVFSWRFQ